MIHINVTSPASIHHVGDDSLAYANHVESMSPAIVNDVGGIGKLIRLRLKTKFFCRTCEGNHLTRLCLVTVGIPKAWRSPKGPSYSEVSVVSPHLVSLLIDMTTMLPQSSPEHTPVVEGDVSPIPIIMHPLQPRVEEVVIPVKPLVNPNLFLEGDVFFNHVVNIPDTAPYEQEIFLLSSSTLPSIPGDIPFDWDGLVGYPMPLPMSFLVRYII
jgi:hypothetical protein